MLLIVEDLDEDELNMRGVKGLNACWAKWRPL